MANEKIVISSELGPEFETTGAITPGKIRLKLGNNLNIAPNGTLSSNDIYIDRGSFDPLSNSIGLYHNNNTSTVFADANVIIDLSNLIPADQGDLTSNSVFTGNGDETITLTHISSTGATKDVVINIPAPPVIIDQGSFSIITTLDLDGTVTHNITHTTSNGVVSSGTIVIPNTASPWDNANSNNFATQGSTDIKYDAGNVGIGVIQPLAQLHLGGVNVNSLVEFRQDFTASLGTTGLPSAYIQNSNDGTGNFHKYWNTEGGTAPTYLDFGYALHELYTASSPWYIIRGADRLPAGDPIVWGEIHGYNMATGQHRFPQYGQGTFDATPTRLLGTTATGDIIEVDPATIGSSSDTDVSAVDVTTQLNIVRVSVTENGNTIVGADTFPVRKASNTYITAYDISGNGNADDVKLTLTPITTNTGWTLANDEVTWTGIVQSETITPEYAKIHVHAYYDFGPIDSPAYQRIAPEIQLLKNGVPVTQAGSAYQRHANDHASSSNTIVYFDGSPSAGDVWSIRSQRGSTQTDILNVTYGQISIEMVEELNYLTPAPI